MNKEDPSRLKIELYSRDNCEWCEFAKDLLATHNLLYTEYKFGVDYTKDILKLRLGLSDDAPLTVPQIFINDKAVGGFNDLKSFLDMSSTFDILINRTWS